MRVNQNVGSSFYDRPVAFFPPRGELGVVVVSLRGQFVFWEAFFLRPNCLSSLLLFSFPSVVPSFLSFYILYFSSYLSVYALLAILLTVKKKRLIQHKQVCVTVC